MKLTKAERSELNALILAYEKAADELVGFLRDLATEWRDTFDEKSEKWRESEPGQAAEGRITEAEAIADDIENASVDIARLD